MKSRTFGRQIFGHDVFAASCKLGQGVKAVRHSFVISSQIFDHVGGGQVPFAILDC